MIALYVFGGLILLILLIVFSNIRIVVEYENDLTVRVEFWCFRYTLIPMKEKLKKEQKKQEKAAEIKEEKSVKKKGFLDTVRDTISTTKLIMSKLEPVFKSIHIKPLYIYIGVGGDNAAFTAIATGTANAVVHPFVAWMSDNVEVKKTDVTIVPNYNAKSEFHFKTRIYIRINHIVAAAARILFAMAARKSKKDGAQK